MKLLYMPNGDRTLRINVALVLRVKTAAMNVAKASVNAATRAKNATVPKFAITAASF